MRMGTGGCWLAVGLLFGCTPTPPEVVGPYDGTAGSSGSASEGAPTSGEPDTGTTGPIAEGSAGSGTGMPTTMTGDTGTTAPVDPVTTDPDTSSSGDPPTESTSGDPGSSSGAPLTCEQIFGDADGYTPCAEDDTSCTFALYSNSADCNTICGMFGQPCLGGIDNPDGLNCTYGNDLACDEAEQSEGTICVCAK